WTTGSDMYYGTRVRLPTNWTTAAVLSAPWEADAEACNSTVTRVWCVGEIVAPKIYLPVLLKSY
ncbi:MAG: hypothetical protein JW908_02410, partial [Anaerolineales bacterium]|nr:hypothetical protein [Anaerolineales bacterium]